MSELTTKWPEPTDFGYAFDELSAKDAALRFQRARAEAALERLRLAVEALKLVQAESRTNDSLWFEAVYDKIVTKALIAIGHLPDLPPVQKEG